MNISFVVIFIACGCFVLFVSYLSYLILRKSQKKVIDYSSIKDGYDCSATQLSSKNDNHSRYDNASMGGPIRWN